MESWPAGDYGDMPAAVTATLQDRGRGHAAVFQYSIRCGLFLIDLVSCNKEHLLRACAPKVGYYVGKTALFFFFFFSRLSSLPGICECHAGQSANLARPSFDDLIDMHVSLRQSLTAFAFRGQREPMCANRGYMPTRGTPLLRSMLNTAMTALRPEWRLSKEGTSRLLDRGAPCMSKLHRHSHHESDSCKCNTKGGRII